MPSAAALQAPKHDPVPPSSTADELVRIGVDGSVSLHPSLTPDEASQIFWDALSARSTRFAAAIRAAAFREAAAITAGNMSRGETVEALLARVETEERQALA